MGFLGNLFGSRKKVNLTPDISYMMPNQINPEMYGKLSTLAKQRIDAGTTGEETPGVGFGPDFLSRASNPAIAKSDDYFRSTTMPRISSELSKRGVARSGGAGLATDVIGRAEREQNLDIQELLSKFMVLNEAQKKTDITQGIGVGQNLLSGDVAQANNQAAASERLSERTAGDSIARDASNSARDSKILMTALGAITGGSTGGVSGGLVGAQGGFSGQSPLPVQSSGTSTKILGASNADFEAWLDSILGGQ